MTGATQLTALKIKKELGWEAENDFERALEKTVNWYVNNEDWWRPLKK